MKIIIFGPNGSGKSTYGSLISNRLGLSSIEAGKMFREHVKNQTELGIEAQKFISEGKLVPNNITVPMVMDSVAFQDRWILDGYPRNVIQAESLWNEMKRKRVGIDYVININVDKEVAKTRMMGRRGCINDPHHPNNVSNPEIAPVNGKCQVCGSKVLTRPDDANEDVVNKRLEVFYDPGDGTMGAVAFFKARNGDEGSPKFIELDGEQSIEDSWRELQIMLGIGTKYAAG